MPQVLSRYFIYLSSFVLDAISFTMMQIAEMYERQVLSQSKGGKKKNGGDADDEFW